MPPIIFLKGEESKMTETAVTNIEGVEDFDEQLNRKITSRYPKEVMILGQKYHVQFLDEENAPEFEKMHGAADGYCRPLEKVIVVKDEDFQHFPISFTEEAKIRAFNAILRHEIMHAFLYESGLDMCTVIIGQRPWATNEEMVDWLAIQGPKIVKAWKDMNCEEE